MLLLPIASLLLYTHTPPALAESPGEWVAQAQAAYQQGDLKTARQLISIAQKLDPRNTAVTALMRKIQLEEKKRGPVDSIEKRLRAVILPRVQFQDAPLAQALEALKQQVAIASENKVTLSIVAQLPPSLLQSKTISLDLTAVPASEALRYVAALAGAAVVYDPFAVVLKPASPAGAPPNSPNSPAASRPSAVPGTEPPPQ